MTFGTNSIARKTTPTVENPNCIFAPQTFAKALLGILGHGVRAWRTARHARSRDGWRIPEEGSVRAQHGDSTIQNSAGKKEQGMREARLNMTSR